MTTLTQRALAVIRQCPQGITPQALAARVYSDKDGGPLTAVDCVHVMALKLKRKGLIVAEGDNFSKLYKPAPSPAWDASALLALPC